MREATSPSSSSAPWIFELDHVIARARGGTNEVGNLRVRCRAHNALHAEQTFGKEHVERRIRERRDPRRRGQASESCDLAAKGLVKMGFRRAEVQRALDTVSARHRADDLSTLPVQTILREALAILTDDFRRRKGVESRGNREKRTDHHFFSERNGVVHG